MVRLLDTDCTYTFSDYFKVSTKNKICA